MRTRGAPCVDRYQPVTDYYDRNGAPMSLEDWVSTFAGPPEEMLEKKRIRYTEIPETGVCVSTVWLGLDHQFGDGPPLIFETMVFGLPDEMEIMERYSTEEQAIEGHWQVVQSLVGNAVDIGQIRHQEEG